MKMKTLLLAVLVAALQIGFLAWMIAGRATILRDGAEVALKTEPYDPRDLLRGQYVRLNYAISTLPVEHFRQTARSDLVEGAAIRVHLVAGPDGLWVSDQAAVGAGADGADRTWILGRISRGVTDYDNTVSVTYGIERFYAPETEAPEIEKRMRDGQASVVIAAIGRDGTVQIKALKQDSETLYTEPLY